MGKTIKMMEIIAQAGALAFTPIFIYSIIINDPNHCIKILEPISWIRWSELIMAFYIMIFFSYNLLKEVVDWAIK